MEEKQKIELRKFAKKTKKKVIEIKTSVSNKQHPEKKAILFLLNSFLSELNKILE